MVIAANNDHVLNAEKSSALFKSASPTHFFKLYFSVDYDLVKILCFSQPGS